MKIHYLIGLIILGFYSTASGQDVIQMNSTTEGLSAGVHLGLLSYTDDKIHAETEGGVGFGAEVQYGFTHQIAASLAFQHYSVTPKSINSTDTKYPYTEIELLGKYIFGSSDQKLRPNLTLGINYTKSKENFYDPQFNFASLQTYSGLSLCGGGGLRYFLSSQMSIDLALLFNWGDYTTTLINGQEVDVEHSYFSWKTLLGFSYHF